MTDEIKTISVQDPGPSRIENDVQVLPGETAEQLIEMILPKWNLTREGRTYLLKVVGSDKPIKGDLYKAVKNGDKLLLYWIDRGALNI